MLPVPAAVFGLATAVTAPWILTLSASLTANRTWTLPDRSDTFAGLAAQTFTGVQTFTAQAVFGTASGLTGASLELASAFPLIRWWESDQAVDAKNWHMGCASGAFYIQALTDAGSGGATAFSLARSGNQITTVVLPSGNSSYTIGVPHWQFSGDSNTGPARVASDQFGIICGGVLSEVITAGITYRYGFGGVPARTFRRANGTEAAPTKVLSGEPIGRLQFGGYYDDGAGAVGYDNDQAWIDAAATADWSAAAICPARLRFYVSATAGGAAAHAGHIYPGGALVWGQDTAPLATLDTITTPNVQLVGTTTANQSSLGLIRFDATAGDCPTIQLAHSKSNTLSTYVATTTNDVLGIIYGLGVDATATGFRRAAAIKFYQGNVSGAAVVPGGIILAVYDTSGVERNAVVINSDQQAIFSDGTVALPSMAFASSPTTGFLRSGASQIDVASAGISRWRFQAGGNLFLNRNAVVTDTILASNPATINGLWAWGLDAGTIGMGYDAFGANGYIMARRSNGTAAVPTQLVTGNTILALEARGYFQGGTSGLSTSSHAAIRLHAGDTWTDTSRSAYIAFTSTNIGSTTPVVVWRITPRGDLCGFDADSLNGFDAGTVTPRMQVAGSGSISSGAISAFSGSTSAAQSPVIFLGRSRANIAYTTVVTGDSIGRVSFQGADGTDLAECASIVVSCEGTIAANQVPGLFKIRTANASGTITDALTINSAQTATFAGNIVTAAASYIYLGAEATDGTWRFVRSGNDLIFERRESGSYVEKSRIAA